MSTAATKSRPRTADPVRNLAMELETSQVLLANLKDVAAGDDDFLTDLVEGETDLFEIIAKIDESELDDQIMIDGITAHIKKLQDRKKKAEGRVEAKRALLATALSQIGLKNHRTPLGTISISSKALIAIVQDEAAIPSRFWDQPAPKLDKTALNEALRARARAVADASSIEDLTERKAAVALAAALHPEIPGAVASNGGVQITIRRT